MSQVLTENTSPAGSGDHQAPEMIVASDGCVGLSGQTVKQTIAHTNEQAISSADFDWRRELRELVAFLRKPVRGHAKVLTLRQGWRRIALMLALNFCFIVIVTLPINAALEHWAGLDESVKSDATKISQWVIIALIAPLLEELIFRAGLRQVTYSLFVAPVLVASMRADKMFVLIMVGILLSIAAADAIRLRYTASAVSIRFARSRAFIRRYPYVFWMYAISFGLVHISNLYSTNGRDYWLVFAVSSQLFGGALLGYLRLRQGLRSAIAYHVLFNAVCLCAELLFP
jgi:membrane protease YdiL (CAAX protease family)